MGLPRFFKQPRHNRFNYQPLYYNETKEKIAKEKEKHSEKKEYKPDIKFKSKINREQTSIHNRTSNMRLFAIIGILAFILYYVFVHFELISKMFGVFFDK